ncbi:MAG TPA: hypothetical protein VMT16_05880, partial [Thermoanaerobaculia bacterium]|nr:hypothetical protein [Thermoanaerobaculia bacterium]
PQPWVEGLDWVRFKERTAEGIGQVYLFGELRSGEGFAGYYLWAWLFKTPLAAQILALAAFGAWWARRRRFRFLENELFLLLPLAFFIVYFNFFYRAQIGFRFMLVAVPLVHVFTSSLLHRPSPLRRRLRWALPALLAWQVVSVLSWFPHFIPYVNELVRPRWHGYRILSDSNIDWGQAQWHKDRWLEEHPQAIFEPVRPTAGTVVVRVSYLTAVVRPRQYRWLRNYMQPVDHIAYAYLVYEVTPEDLEAMPRRALW